MSSGADLFVVCKTCGSEVSAFITECPYCGTRLRKRAPKLDRPGASPRRPRRPGARLRRDRPRLGRLRPGEMPGIRYDTRPFVTIVLVVASIAVALAWQARAVSLRDLAVFGPLGDQWWRVLTAPFAYDNSGYLLCAAVGIGLFGWLLERRHGAWAPLALFVAGGCGGMLVAATVEAIPVALGANGAALALLGAWVVPDLQERHRDGETDSDLIGVAVIAAVLLLLPFAVPDANPIVGLAGGLIGLILGLPLAALSRVR
ncbi:MAG: rhomboid family intramembrane serine protease [Solirubrobacteraceae bacterium]